MAGFIPLLASVAGATAVGVGTAAVAKKLSAPSSRAPPLPGAPTADVAANDATQVQDDIRRRRGVLANIYAGQNPSDPTNVLKTQLGT